MIETKGLVKRFGNFKALDEADMTVKKGSVYGLVGPNGAGKTTLIRHVSGVYKQDAGELLIDGQRVYNNSETKARIATIPDDWFYFSTANTEEMAKFYASVYKNFSFDRFKKLGSAFDIDEKHEIRKLSKGMQKQVAFRLALSTMPDYLVLDEPVDGLDPVMRRQVWSLMMDDVTERGTTVLVSSHNLRELEDVCDYVGIMNKGKVLLERSLTSLQDNMVKLQVVFPEGIDEVPNSIPVLHASKLGRVHTLIMRMNADDAVNMVLPYKPVLADPIPLTLEEIFIYEMGGADYAIKEIIL